MLSQCWKTQNWVTWETNMTCVLIFKESIHRGLASLCTLYFSYTVTMGEGISEVSQQHCCHVQTGPQVWERGQSLKSHSRGKVSPRGSLQSSKQAQFVNVWLQLHNTASVSWLEKKEKKKWCLGNVKLCGRHWNYGHIAIGCTLSISIKKHFS